MTSKPPQTRGPVIADLPKRFDRLLVLDVDEVVLEFIEPFRTLLGEHGAALHADSFKLTGNVRSVATGAALTGNQLGELTQRLYEEQAERQKPVAGVVPALKRLSQKADILFLTAMTPDYYPQRRELLDRSGLTYPMIATTRGKGGVVAELCERWSGPVVFVDDLPPNLEAVHRSAPRVRLLHLMANSIFRKHLPALPQAVEPASDWQDAEARIEALLAET